MRAQTSRSTSLRSSRQDLPTHGVISVGHDAAVQDATHGLLDQVERHDEPLPRLHVPAKDDFYLQIRMGKELMEQLLKFPRREIRLERRADLYRRTEERRILFHVGKALVHVLRREADLEEAALQRKDVRVYGKAFDDIDRSLEFTELVRWRFAREERA